MGDTYICLQYFLLSICVYGIAWFCYFFHIINVFHNFFDELCEYILCIYWLILMSILLMDVMLCNWWLTSKHMWYMWLLYNLVNFWTSFEYLQDYSCSSPIGRIWFQVNIIFALDQDKTKNRLIAVSFKLFYEKQLVNQIFICRSHSGYFLILWSMYMCLYYLFVICTAC